MAPPGLTASVLLLRLCQQRECPTNTGRDSAALLPLVTHAPLVLIIVETLDPARPASSTPCTSESDQRQVFYCCCKYFDELKHL